MTLFDPDHYTAPGATPKRPRRPTPPQPQPHTEAVVVNSRWRFGHRKSPGVVHCGATNDKGKLRTNSTGGTATMCGLIGIPLTYDVGTTVHGCGVCIDRGAPVAEQAAS